MLRAVGRAGAPNFKQTPLVVQRGRQRRSIACCSLSHAFRSRKAGAGRIPRVVRCTAVAEVVAVVGLLCEIQSAILRNLDVAITLRGSNDTRYLVQLVL